MRLTPSWVAYSEKVFKKVQAAEDAMITKALKLPPPKPHYAKGDTTAATNRLAELRLAEKVALSEKLALQVPTELITPIEEQAARYKPRFMAFVDGILARPFRPAKRGECPEPEIPIAGPIELKDSDVQSLAASPAAAAIAALCGCRWPIGEPTDEGFHFCNRKRTAHFYCDAHAEESKK